MDDGGGTMDAGMRAVAPFFCESYNNIEKFSILNLRHDFFKRKNLHAKHNKNGMHWGVRVQGKIRVYRSDKVNTDKNFSDLSGTHKVRMFGSYTGTKMLFALAKSNDNGQWCDFV